jgi:hypothetical protein
MFLSGQRCHRSLTPFDHEHEIRFSALLRTGDVMFCSSASVHVPAAGSYQRALAPGARRACVPPESASECWGPPSAPRSGSEELRALPLQRSRPACASAPRVLRSACCLRTPPASGIPPPLDVVCAGSGIPLVARPVSGERHETPCPILLDLLDDPDRLCSRHWLTSMNLPAAYGASVVSVGTSQTALCRSMVSIGRL